MKKFSIAMFCKKIHIDNFFCERFVIWIIWLDMEISFTVKFVFLTFNNTRKRKVFDGIYKLMKSNRRKNKIKTFSNFLYWKKKNHLNIFSWISEIQMNCLCGMAIWIDWMSTWINNKITYCGLAACRSDA